MDNLLSQPLVPLGLTHGEAPSSGASIVPSLSAAAVDCGVATIAQRDQILFAVMAQTASKFFVVYFQAEHSAAQLTPPAIPTQHQLPQPFVRCFAQPQAQGLRADRTHDVLSLKPSKNSCC